MEQLVELIEYLNNIVEERSGEFSDRFLGGNELMSIHYGEANVFVSYLHIDGIIFFDTITLEDFRKWLDGK
jgi:hypothetical protein